MTETKAARTIVVVEADDGIRASLRFMLQAEGFAVETYGDGASALAAPAIFAADAFILDHSLPDISGPDLLLRLRALQIQAPALFLAGRITPLLRRAAAELDAPIVSKPLIGDTMSQAVARLLAGAPPRATPANDRF